MNNKNICPSCGAPLNAKDTTKCEYCGVIVGSQAVQNVNISKEELVEAIKSAKDEIDISPRKRKLSLPKRIALCVMVIGLVVGIFVWLFNGIGSTGDISELWGHNILSNEEAKEVLIDHLTEKYPHMMLTPENILLFSRDIFVLENLEVVPIGYKGEVFLEDTWFSVNLFAWNNKGRGRTQVMIFDDYQLEMITARLQEEILYELKSDGGHSFLNFAINSPLNNFVMGQLTGFNTYFTDGDLEGFFQEEARAREDFFGTFIEKGLIEEREYLNVNGRFTMYLQDPYVLSLSERLEHFEYKDMQEEKAALDGKAEKYGLQITLMFFPLDYYRHAFEGLPGELNVDLLNLPFRNSHEAPFLAPLITRWYNSADENGEGQLFQQEAKTMEEGLYVMGAATDPAWGTFQGLEVETPKDVVDFLRDSGFEDKETQSFLVRGITDHGVLIINKRERGINETGYRIVHTNISTSEHEFVSIKTQVGEQAFINRFVASVFQFENYLIFSVGNLREEERVVTIVYNPSD